MGVRDSVCFAAYYLANLACLVDLSVIWYTDFQLGYAEAAFHVLCLGIKSNKINWTVP